MAFLVGLNGLDENIENDGALTRVNEQQIGFGGIFFFFPHNVKC